MNLRGLGPCSVVLALAATARAQTCFEGPRSFGTGSYPLQLVHADFNSDGWEDLATVNYTSTTSPGSVSVLINIGAGVFAPQANYPVGFGPESLAVGDFDNDGHPDLVVANTWGASCTVLHNLGNGTFAPAALLVANNYPATLVCADVNADGFVDIAVGGNFGFTGYVGLYLNLGTSGFSAPQYYTTGGAPTAIAAADLNGDGYVDLATASEYGEALSVLLNVGPGQFPAHADFATGPEPHSLVAADLDGDGDLDLALANAGYSTAPNGNLSLYFNTGAGVFAPQVGIPTNDATIGLDAADFDGDGIVDLVLSNANSGGNLWLLHNQGAGSFVQVAAVAAGSLPYSVVAIDFDRDGTLDLASALWASSAVSVLRNCSAIPPSFCFGDGTLAPCPCGNNGASGRGCQNSAATGGALLSTSGTASLGIDTLVLQSSGELASATSIFLQGSVVVSPAAFGDGLRCVGGPLRRLFSATASGGVVAQPAPGGLSISARSSATGDPIAVGTVRYYQVYYRDPDPTFCPAPQGNTWNVSSAVSVPWAP